MRPSANSHGFQEQPKRVINGPRPSPLVVKGNSHLIRKTASSQQQQVRKPIIIYTHSPKVIHTQAKDFMALVQRLTGKSSRNFASSLSDQPPQESLENFGSSVSDGSNNSIKQEEQQWKLGACDGDETSSALKGNNANVQVQPSFADMPLFTPNSSDFLTPSRSLYRYNYDSPFGILGSLISPSGLEFIRELPEY